MDDEHSLPYSVNCSTLLLDLPLEERPAAAASAGFAWIELWWPFERAVPSAAEVDAFARRVEEAGVRVGCLSLANRDTSSGVRFHSPLRGAALGERQLGPLPPPAGAGGRRLRSFVLF